MQHDVLIIGGGSSGVAAAIGASRAGAATALLERAEYLGGMATGAMVGTVCGLHYRSEQSEARYVSGGLSFEFGERLRELSNTEPIAYKEGLHFLPYDPDAFAELCSALLKEAKVELFLNATAEACEVANDRIQSVTTSADNTTSAFHAKSVVDCTGNAVITRLAGRGVIHPEREQASAIVFSMSGIEAMDARALRMLLLRDVKRAVQREELQARCERVSVVPGSHREGSASFKLGLPRAVDNVEELAHELIDELSQFLITNVAAFKDAAVATIAKAVGVRSGDRPIGKNTLQTEDVLNAAKFDDGIARGAWPIEFWEDDPAPRMEYFAMDDYYEIPAGALHSASTENLFFAGKSFSATDDAMASARVIGTCLATGYAAGRMAAFEAQGKPVAHAVHELRNDLKTSVASP